MTEPVFQVDQKITPLYTSGYAITMGKEYTVLKYEPAVRDAEFTWPPYVHFVNDFGKKCVAHAARFTEVIHD